MPGAAIARKLSILAISIFSMVGVVVLATPASAAQEVGRVHPALVGNALAGPNIIVLDQEMTMVKYYNGAAYQFCVLNSHNTGEVTSYFAVVDWSDNSGAVLERDRTLMPLQGPGALKCTEWKLLHGSQRVEYAFNGGYWVGTL